METHRGWHRLNMPKWRWVSLLSLGREVGKALDSVMTMIQGAGPGFCLGTGLGQSQQTSMRASLEVAIN